MGSPVDNVRSLFVLFYSAFIGKRYWMSPVHSGRALCSTCEYELVVVLSLTGHVSERLPGKDALAACSESRRPGYCHGIMLLGKLE